MAAEIETSACEWDTFIKMLYKVDISGSCSQCKVIKLDRVFMLETT